MSEQAKKRRTFWLADAMTPLLRDRALLLNEKGYEVHIFTSLSGFLVELTTKRPSVIVVSDGGDERVTIRTLKSLIGLPEVQGSRMVMVSTTASEQAAFLAASGNFRDIIPANLEEKLWLTRFIYATAGRAMPYVQPAGQMTLNNISALSLPGRLTWAGERHLRLECRARPPAGAVINLRGPIADTLGIPGVSLKVIATERSHLLYRFSDAITCEWSVPLTAKPRMDALLDELKKADPGPRNRVFLAIQTPEMRTEALALFNEPRFEVKSALSRQSMVDEPKFFTPDIVIVEASLYREDASRFSQMLQAVSSSATVFVIGIKEAIAENLSTTKQIVTLSKLPRSLTSSPFARYLPEPVPAREPNGERGAYISSGHPLSFAEINFPARLHRLHPLAAQLALPFPVGTFALARLDSPLVHKMLGRHPYLKVTAAYADTHPDAAPFIYAIDCYLADVDQEERRIIATELSQLMSQNLATFDPTGSFTGGRTGGDVRTPELGSLKSRLVAVPNSSRPILGAAAQQSSLQSSAQAARILEPQLPQTPAAKLDLVAPVPTPPPAPPPAHTSGPHGVVRTPTQQLAALAAAQKLREEAEVDSLTSAVRPVRVSVKTKELSLGQILLAIAALVAVGGLIWGVYVAVAANVNKSGSVYSDQLKKFAPHLSGGK